MQTETFYFLFWGKKSGQANPEMIWMNIMSPASLLTSIWWTCSTVWLISDVQWHCWPVCSVYGSITQSINWAAGCFCLVLSPSVSPMILSQVQTWFYLHEWLMASWRSLSLSLPPVFISRAKRWLNRGRKGQQGFNEWRQDHFGAVD